ncbi:response regulator [Paenibacillus piri]|uniref:Transcriptional regulatory protein n=1 Tax=Paenibacillus piri TaxID=2547395 RepID=A0A4R5KUU5_9BACL|nr:response regulator [Paenibacillus piri]TDF99709.1 response regulator [Paenibacillus piri]
MNEATEVPIQVLIIEDDERIAEINRRFVEKVPGFAVVGIATDESQALTQLEVLEPDLVLLDIYFPDANGLELLQLIRRQERQPDVIMITAAKEVEAVKSAIRGGVFDFIMKPLLFNRLQDTLLRFRHYHQTMARLHSEQGCVNQDEVDQLLQGAVKKESGSGYLPKGIDKLTLDKVILAMNECPAPVTAEQAAALIGVSRSTARRYLEHLVSKGQLRADLSYGDVGRPERVYRKL